MKITFQKLDLPDESQILIEWLSSAEWPFHGNSRLTPEKVKSMIDAGTFDGTDHQTFWILSAEAERIGYIRLYDLDDIGDGTPLFDIRLKPEIRGKGIGYQAVSWLTKYMFETWPDLHRIEGNTRQDNLAMRRVFRKCHYAKEGHFRETWRTSTGQYFDAIQYGILRGDWIQQKASPVNWNDETEL